MKLNSKLRNVGTTLLLLLTVVAGLVYARMNPATVTTDQQDYYPGDIATISGSGWDAGETVSLVVHPTCDCGDWAGEAVADADGNFSNSDFVLEDHHLGESFVLTATGQTSGQIATHLFTDSPKVGSVSVGSQAPNPVVAGSSAAYVVTVRRGSGGGSSGSFTATMSVLTALPAGTTASFSPNPVSFAPGDTVKTSTLTLSTTGATPAGTSTFDVKASTSASDFAVTPTTGTSGTLVVQAADNAAPTSSASAPGANAANWHNSNISVVLSATDNVGGTGVQSITYSASGAQTIAATTVAGASAAFAVSGEGTTTITYAAKDIAGNTEAANTLTVKLDKTSPAISFAAQSPAKNANGWNNVNASIGFTASDPGGAIASGIAPSSPSSPLSFSSEGANQTQSVTVSDIAGNSTTAATPIVVNIDKTSPTIDYGAKSVASNGAGWNNNDLTIPFTASDAGGSGVDTTSAASPLSYTAESASDVRTVSATDRAGNSASFNAPEVKLDKTNPSLDFGAQTPAANSHGWNNTSVSVPWSASDGLSGLVGAASGAVSFDSEGANQSDLVVVYDLAGNFVSQSNAPVSIDLTKPTLSFADAAPAANSSGWNNSDVTFHWGAADTLSGVDGAAAGDTVLSSESDDVSGSVTVTDKAGNTETFATAHVKIDKTKPTLAFGAATPAPNAHGWNNTAVSISYAAHDALAGVEEALTPGMSALAFTAEGADQHQEVTITDKAGNSETFTTSTGVNIDITPPTVTAVPSRSSDAPSNWYRAPVTWTFTGHDLGGSGVDAVSSPATYSGPDGKPVFVSATVTDKAGNSGGDQFYFNYDATAPVIHIAGASEGDYARELSISATADDLELAGISAELDGAPFMLGSLLQVEGVHTLVVSASDSAGNHSSETVHFTIDRTSPVILFDVDSPADGGQYNATQTLLYSLFDNLDPTPTYTSQQLFSRLGAGDLPPLAITSPHSVSDEGLHSVSLNAEDAATNHVHVGRSFLIDLTMPQSTSSAVGSMGDNGWFVDDVAVAINSNDPDIRPNADPDQRIAGSGISQLAFQVNSGSWNYEPSCATGFSITSEGVYTIQYHAKDSAGNIEGVNSRTVRYDRTAPSTLAAVSSSANGAGWRKDDFTVGLSAADQDGLSGVSKVIYTVNGGAEHITSGDSATFAFDTDGVYEIVYHAVDNAGNSESAHTMTVRLDKTAPTLAFEDQSPAANANGWNNTDVSIGFSTDDNLSGVETISDGGPLLFSQETSAATKSVTVTDAAGNSAIFTTHVVKIDKTAPQIHFDMQSPAANGNGWNNTDVAMPYSLTDDRSGIDGDADGTLHFTSEGAGQTQHVAATDLAGNTAGADSPGVNIDKTKPTLTFGSQLPAANAHGWNKTDVTFDWTAGDNISDVDGPTAGTVNITSEGSAQTGSVIISDLAGNSETFTTLAVKIDKTDPVLSLDAQTPTQNAHGWNNGPVSIHYSSSDAGSGIDGAASGNLSFSSEGANQTQSVTVTDLAGNSKSITTPGVNIDLTAPAVLFGAASPAANGNGWNNTNVSIPWTSSDNLSQIDGANVGALSFATETAGSTQNVTATDKAGNSATFASPTVKLDKTAPVITAPTALSAVATTSAGAVVTYAVAADGSISGLQGPVVSAPASGSVFAPGTTLVNCTALDIAGNIAVKTFPVSVTFDWSNFLQPINLNGTSVFKLGSTLPVKFRLAGASAGVTNLVAHLYAAKLSNGVAGTEVEPVSTSNADTGNQFRYSGSDSQYIFNLSLRTPIFSEGTWQLRVDLHDGQAHTVIISIRR